MLSGSVSSGLHGINAEIVEIEVDTVKGLPGFTIVGLPDSTIRESRERIRSAIENSGFEFPPKNYIVNLAPAGFKKQGANFDLGIALSILRSTDQISCETKSIPMVGELSLDGRVKPVRGAISMAISFYKAGYKSLIVPCANSNEAAAIDGIAVFPVKNIIDAIDILSGKAREHSAKHVSDNSLKQIPDFSDVRGQENAKRALEIAAAGRHNIILYGAPGSGKTMLAKRIPGILPPLTREQAIETTMIHSSGGSLKCGTGLIYDPPFRSPHHTASDIALTGGGAQPSVGEVSLSHNGILFLDEFVEFKSNVIQAMRQPLEDASITVSRATGTHTFPADFMLVAASNPCRCGYLFDDEVSCTCTAGKVKGYFQKIAGPIIDRIDIEVLVNRVPYKKILSDKKEESSAEIKNRVIAAREIQSKRFNGNTAKNNSRMTRDDIETYCRLDPESERLLESAMKVMNLTARSFFKIIKISRTIADLENSEKISKKHLLEALSYKNLYKNYER